MRKMKMRILAFLLAVSMITSGMAPALDVQAEEIQTECLGKDSDKCR